MMVLSQKITKLYRILDTLERYRRVICYFIRQWKERNLNNCKIFKSLNFAHQSNHIMHPSFGWTKDKKALNFKQDVVLLHITDVFWQVLSNFQFQ
jgi:hypothetical protein